MNELEQFIKNAEEKDINSFVWELKFDFNENINHILKTTNYYSRNKTEVYNLYSEMDSGHFIFEDAIRFKFLKLIECIKTLSKVIAIRFYSNKIKYNQNTPYEINKILLNKKQIDKFKNLIHKRNFSAHETDSCEPYVFEQEENIIQNDIKDLSEIFDVFILEYEKLQNIEFNRLGWEIKNKEM